MTSTDAAAAPAPPDPAGERLPALEGRRLLALDGIRAIAILMVLFHEFTHFEGPPTALSKLVHLVATHGATGVTLFFVLSGFLITRNLLAMRDTEHRYRTFYGRRALRIFPVYYAIVFVVLTFWPQDFSLGEELPLWFFFSNWTQPFPRFASPLPHFWSLAVEEQFYLLWPFVVFHATRQRLLRVCAALVVVTIASRALLIHWDFPFAAIYNFSITRMDALVMGSAMAVWLESPQALASLQRARGWVWLAAGASLIVHELFSLAVKRSAPEYAPATYSTAVALICSAVVLSAVAADFTPSRWWHRLLASRPLRVIGKHSFAMYALHVPVALVLSDRLLKWINGDGPIGLAAALQYVVVLSAIIFAAAWLCYVTFEGYFLRRKDVWFPVRRRKNL